MAFCFPNACGGVGGDVGYCRSPFSFRQRCRFSLVGRQDGSPSDQPAYGGFTSVASPAELMRAENPMN